MLLPSYAVDFRGYPACPCLAAWLPVYEAELQRRGILAGQLRIYQLIGGAAASGGTHATGGAADLLDLPGDEDWWVARQMGADASWSRRYDWDGRGGIAHFHLVLTGCPHNAPARYQIDDVRADMNGLAGAHRANDDGPRPLSGRTWREGIDWAHQQQEDDMADPKTQAQLDQIAKDAAAGRAAAEKAVRIAEGLRKRALAQTQRIKAIIEKGHAATEAELEQLHTDVADLADALANED